MNALNRQFGVNGVAFKMLILCYDVFNNQSAKV